MKFSQRIGKTLLTKNIQLESIDDELKNGLWNVYDLHILKQIPNQQDWHHFAINLWHNYFKKRIDKMPHIQFLIQNEIRDYFFSCEWYENYDLIEFTVNNMSGEITSKKKFVMLLILFLRGNLQVTDLLNRNFHQSQT